ncbi:alpha-L-rhamnosidase-like protein [Chitinophaga dinghuensis]|uniref:Alpha-L-rhamnosidase-like protein n=1 Tax=Chitinophaga dinghuensis TaxID=1539050 RepID=A0A327VSG9_9BACT|nr:glycosyl hydrolase [Chitinophaga dinghuensis]RAJ77327.1 alpha-L-rhamnosidase-like protein [Chitinophaga dinghuensis]
MQKIRFHCLLIALLLTGVLATAQQRLQGFEEVAASFRNPGRDFGSVPFWVWNTKVTKGQIDAMLQDYKKNDFGGVIIHARPGLITEWLSKDWFDLFEYAVQQGKKLGLNIWIYDENSYPTGFAGGLVADQMPAAYNQGQMLYMEDTTRLPADLTPYFLLLKEVDGSYTDVSPNIAAETLKIGHYLLFKKVNYQRGNRGSVAGPIGVSYVDLMAKGVTEKFMDVAYKSYEKVIGQEFGKTIKGVFSDEPTIINEGRNSVRWTPDLFDRFYQEWHYDLRLHLPSLFKEVGDWKRVRHNYYKVLLELFIDRWSKPVAAYMKGRKLTWTGHYWEHGWPSPYHGPDNMAMYAWHQMPGIDMLFNQFNEDKPVQFGNIRAVKELSSVANQLNKTRTLSETYGGSGWELTFKDMKRLADWEFVLGVNFLNQHLSFMTLTGARKYDYPPSFSYHEPWWTYYKNVNHYYSRLSYMLSKGQQYNDILIIEPTTSAWMYYAKDGENKRFFDITKSFNDMVTMMQRGFLEYDLGSENIIKDHGSVKGNRFVIGQRSYKVVVIPPGMENMDHTTFTLLKKFMAAGGKVVCFEQLRFVDGVPNKALIKLPSVHEATPASLASLFQNNGFTIFPVTGDSIGGNLYHQRRRLSNGQLLLLTNASMTEASTGTIAMQGQDVLQLDLQTGDISRIDFTRKNGQVQFNFQLLPAGSKMLFIADKQLPGYKVAASSAAWTTMSTGASTIHPIAENSLTIDFCDLHLPDTSYANLHVGMASNAAFKRHGFTDGVGNPWNNRTQYRDAITRRDTFSIGTGYTAVYRFTVKPGVDVTNFKAVLEQPGLWKEVKMNGVAIKSTPGQWWLDRSYGVYSIGRHVRIGDNELAVTVTPMSVYAEIEPIYILGDFHLESAAQGWTIVAPRPLQLGSWKAQGLPLYGNGVVYTKEFRADTLADDYQVMLGSWKGTVAAVKVNDSLAGIISAEPNSLAIRKFMKQGKNKVEVIVVGSLKNVLGPFYKKPVPGLVDPGKWYNVSTQPAGKEYDLYDYGLIDDYEIRALHESR